MNFKKEASSRDKLSNKKKIYICNEDPQRIFGDEMSYFLTLFGSYLPQTTWYGAENFITASSLHPQHILEISCDLNVPGLRSIF
jgi:hypothetical protein